MYNYSSVGQRDALISPNINLEQGQDYNLYFSYAHQNRNAGSHDDSLIVEISTDCGVNFYRVFAKGGDNLETTDTLDLNFEPSYPTHWRNETIILAEYVPEASSIILKISTVNGKQNNLYLDNVIVSTAEEFSLTEQVDNSFSVFPNPANSTIQLVYNGNKNKETKVYLLDLTGRVLETKTLLTNKLNWDVSSYNNGCYIFKVQSDGATLSKSFIKM
tara:strand:- start:30 stop:680 length:651 start_codon:yes stop_codon:yes gene_type:complete